MKNLQILVVEDTKEWREQIVSILNLNGYHINTAQNYTEAHGYLTKGGFDLLLVDINLGSNSENRDGIIILKDAFGRGIPSIVITAYGTRETIEKANVYAAVRFFHKQRFKPVEFLQSVEEISRSHNSSFPKPTQREEKGLAELIRKLIAGEQIK
jgi:DNA-binding NtrC family response regulator